MSIKLVSDICGLKSTNIKGWWVVAVLMVALAAYVQLLPDSRARAELAAGGQEAPPPPPQGQLSGDTL